MRKALLIIGGLAVVFVVAGVVLVRMYLPSGMDWLIGYFQTQGGDYVGTTADGRVLTLSVVAWPKHGEASAELDAPIVGSPHLDLHASFAADGTITFPGLHLSGHFADGDEHFVGEWRPSDSAAPMPITLTRVCVITPHSDSSYEWSPGRSVHTSRSMLAAGLHGDSAMHRAINDQLAQDVKQFFPSIHADDHAGGGTHSQSDASGSGSITQAFRRDDLVTLDSGNLVSMLTVERDSISNVGDTIRLTGRTWAWHGDRLQTLYLSDLFSKGSDWPLRLRQLCYDALKKQGAAKMVHAEQVKADDPPVIVDDISAFTVNAHGLRVYFAPGVVGDKTAGVYSVSLSFDQLAKLIKPDGPCGRMMEIAMDHHDH